MADRGGGGTTGLRERTRSSALGNLVVLAVVTALILGAAWWLNQGSGAGDASAVDVPVSAGPAPEVGGPAPDFAALTTAGETVSLSGLSGRPVWLSFVATWCASCRSEATDVEAVAAANDGAVEVISVYLGEDAATVGTYAERLGMTHLQVPDPGKEIAGRYRIMSVPTHVFIDSAGRIQGTHIGVMTRASMEEWMAELVAASGD